MDYVLPFVLSMAVTMALVPLLARLASRLHIVDRPGGRKTHSGEIPRIGGVAMAIGVLAAMSSFVPTAGRPGLAFVAGAALLLCFGVADDRYDLDYRLKLFGQLAAVALPVFGADVWIHTVTLTDRVELPAWLGIGLTIAFLVGVTNAVNLADGLDGLAGGTSFLCLSALAWLAHSAGQDGAQLLALAFAGAVLGFLRYNTHPAVVFMGDAGSQLLGYSIGVLALLATQSATTVVSASLPILLLGMPILDTLQVIVRRVVAGRSPFRPDRGHLHHRLLGLGFEHHEAVAVIYALQAALFLIAFAERYESDLVVLASYGAVAATVLGALAFAERSGWRLRASKASGAGGAFVTRLISRAYHSGRLQAVASVSVCGGLIGYAGLAIYEARALPSDFRLAVWVLGAALLTLLIVRRGRPLLLLDRAVLYTVLAALAYCDTSVPAGARLVPHADWVLVLGVAVATALALRAGRARGFGITPLDLIVLFLGLVVPNLPGLGALPMNAGQGVAKLVVLFYGLEVAVLYSERRTVWVRASALAAIALLAAEFPMTIG